MIKLKVQYGCIINVYKAAAEHCIRPHPCRQEERLPVQAQAPRKGRGLSGNLEYKLIIVEKIAFLKGTASATL